MRCARRCVNGVSKAHLFVARLPRPVRPETPRGAASAGATWRVAREQILPIWGFKGCGTERPETTSWLESREDGAVRSTQAHMRVAQSIATVVDISTLYTAAAKHTRRRKLDGWLAGAVAGLIWTFVALFVWKVLTPAMSAFVGV